MSLSRHRGVTAHLENYNWSDMRIYLVMDDMRVRRLATLGSLEKRTVTIPPNLLRGGLGFYLEATAIGSGDTVKTPVINAVPGDEIFWTVENQLSISITTLWIR